MDVVPGGNDMSLDDLKFEIADEEQSLGTKIKVVGVGGGGSNAVARMMDEGLGGVGREGRDALDRSRRRRDYRPALLQAQWPLCRLLGAALRCRGRRPMISSHKFVVPPS